MQYTNNILGILTVITIIIEVLLKYTKLEIFLRCIEFCRFGAYGCSVL